MTIEQAARIENAIEALSKANADLNTANRTHSRMSAIRKQAKEDLGIAIKEAVEVQVDEPLANTVEKNKREKD